MRWGTVESSQNWLSAIQGCIPPFCLRSPRIGASVVADLNGARKRLLDAIDQRVPDPAGNQRLAQQRTTGRVGVRYPLAYPADWAMNTRAGFVTSVFGTQVENRAQSAQQPTVVPCEPLTVCDTY